MRTSDSAALQTAATDDSTDSDHSGPLQREPTLRTRVPVSGGVLVYDNRGLGRELAGFEDVTDWDDLRSALAARGHDVGAIHHKPELDGEGR